MVDRRGVTGQSPDQLLLAELGGMFDRVDPPPQWLQELAQLSFDLREVDLEVAELVADSQVDRPTVAVRATAGPAEPRLLTFEADGLLIDLEVTSERRGHRILGQLVPRGRASIEAHQPGRPVRREDSDEMGRFTLGLGTPDPFCLVVRVGSGRVVTSGWVVL